VKASPTSVLLVCDSSHTQRFFGLTKRGFWEKLLFPPLFWTAPRSGGLSPFYQNRAYFFYIEILGCPPVQQGFSGPNFLVKPPPGDSAPIFWKDPPSTHLEIFTQKDGLGKIVIYPVIQFKEGNW